MKKMIREYLEETDRWKVLSEWKIETVTRTLRINSKRKEWSTLIKLGERRTKEEKRLDKYTEKMYRVLKKRAKEVQKPEEEIEKTEEKEKEIFKKLSLLEKELAPDIEKDIARLKKEVFSLHHTSDLVSMRNKWEEHIAERLLAEVLPHNVRMYLMPGEEVLLFIWIEKKDPFSSVDLSFMKAANKIIVVEEERNASPEQIHILQRLFASVERVQKKDGPTEDRTQVAGFKVPSATATP